MPLLPFVGQDFFPSVDSGEFKIHVRASTGTRIEETAALCDRVEDDIRRQIPPAELETIIDNIGVPYMAASTFSYSTWLLAGPGQMPTSKVELWPQAPSVERNTSKMLRPRLARDFPGVTFYDLPVDIVTQILNFGLPAPIDIPRCWCNKLDQANRAFAEKLLNELKFIPGAVDLRIQQPSQLSEISYRCGSHQSGGSRIHAEGCGDRSSHFP